MSRRHDRPRYNTYVILSLLLQIWQQLEHLPYKPPVTCLFLALNIVSFVLPIQILKYDLWDISQNCIRPDKIMQLIRNGEYTKFLHHLALSGFIHVDEHHLYYNMLSLVWKGVQLEQILGSTELFFFIVYSIFASHFLMVFLSYIMITYGIFSWYSGYHDCAVGFSAVLFSMKYVLYMRSDGWIQIYGFPINLKIAAWVELVMISMLNPNASFVGHFAGIVAGMGYQHLIPSFYGITSGIRRSFTFTRSTSRFATSRTNFQSDQGRGVDEQLSARRFVSPEEMRRRRLERYNNR